VARINHSTRLLRLLTIDLRETNSSFGPLRSSLNDWDNAMHLHADAEMGCALDKARVLAKRLDLSPGPPTLGGRDSKNGHPKKLARRRITAEVKQALVPTAPVPLSRPSGATTGSGGVSFLELVRLGRVHGSWNMSANPILCVFFGMQTFVTSSEPSRGMGDLLPSGLGESFGVPCTASSKMRH
jgi:hypothetical protein